MIKLNKVKQGIQKMKPTAKILIWQHGTTENRSAYCRIVVAHTAFRRIVSHH